MRSEAADRNQKASLGPISESPSAYTEDVSFSFKGGDAELQYSYELDGALKIGGVRFIGVRAHSFRAESQCTPWHIEDAYDELVEVNHSDWLSALQSASNDSPYVMKDIHHYLIYLDGTGVFEVAAGRFEWIGDQPTSA